MISSQQLQRDDISITNPWGKERMIRSERRVGRTLGMDATFMKYRYPPRKQDGTEEWHVQAKPGQDWCLFTQILSGR